MEVADNLDEAVQLTRSRLLARQLRLVRNQDNNARSLLRRLGASWRSNKVRKNLFAEHIFNAVGKLGLKLQSRKAPIEMPVVDEAVKTPTENRIRLSDSPFCR